MYCIYHVQLKTIRHIGKYLCRDTGHFVNILCLSTTRRVGNMASSSVMIVHSLPNTDRLSVEFNYSHDGATAKQFRMERLKAEEWGQTLSRLRNSIASKFLKRKRKKKEEAPVEDVQLKFTVNGVEMDTESTVCVSDVLKHGSEVCINEQKYEVFVNPPTVVKIELPKSLMAGFPVFPKIQFLFANPTECEYCWNRVHKDHHTISNSTQKENTKFLSNDKMYTPSNEDIGYKLEVTCVPRQGERSGLPVSAISKVEIEAGPGICPFETRHMYTTEVTDSSSFRVMSYNILADAFADTEFTKTELYPYCASYALSIDYRKQLLLKEILGYNADIICLQEVDERVFFKFLQPALELNGLSGVFQMKSGVIREGEALFYRTAKFRLLMEHNIDLTETLEEECFRDIREKVAKYQDVYEFNKNRKNVLQACVLESVIDPRRKLCVANTHLFFHKDYNYIRLLQGVVSMRHLEKLLESYRQQGGNISLLFCGDFNANPASALHGFMTKSKITPGEYTLQVKDTGEEVTTFDFSHGCDLSSACGYPEYTNYVGAFHGQLDYVFIDHTLEVTSVVPPPGHEEVTQHFALPSVVFPSDHIAQVCVVKWK